MKIPKGLRKEILEKGKIPKSTLYWRVKKKRKDFGNMITEKQAACLIASQYGIDIAKYLDPSELRELRELMSKERFIQMVPSKAQVVTKKFEPSRLKEIKEISPYKIDLDKYNLDAELLRDCSRLVSTKQFRPAIREALLTLETRMRTVMKLGENVVGKELVDKAKENEVFKRDVGSEEEGLYFLYRGAIQWLRNPPGHKKVEYTPEETLKIILFVDYLIKLFEKFASKNLPQ